MVRPVVAKPSMKGTIDDRLLHVCKTGDEPAWALIVYVKTSSSLNAIIVPLLGSPTAEERFLEFIEGSDETLVAHLTRFDGDRWLAAKDPSRLMWPKTGLLYP